ncbi:MAG: FtsX-like permease family protein [Acidobacteriota bacterium]|jgi:putative ABC transport system permease protein|nr:FtsX-like permease family protein [Acidobacteriota bacterium]
MGGRCERFSYPLGTRRLAWENIRSRPFRSLCLMLAAAVVGCSLFGGSVLVIGLERGLRSVGERFGADLMVVPAGAARKAEAILLGGDPGYFHFDGGVADKIARMDGVERVSPQLFMTSLSADCCDALVQLVAFDPATDFVVQPWLARSLGSGLRDGEMVAGNNILVRPDRTVRLFGRRYPVAAKLARTSTGFDTSLFMSRATARQVVAAAQAEELDSPIDPVPEGAVSAVMVKVAEGHTPVYVAWRIRRDNPGVDVIVSQSVVSAISGSLRKFTGRVRDLSCAIWLAAALILAALFAGSANGRKKEFALLRVLGATKGRLAALVLCESALVCAAGGALGVALAALAVFPFNAYIGVKLQLPMLTPAPEAVAALVVASFAATAALGPLAAGFAAVKAGASDPCLTLREGE